MQHDPVVNSAEKLPFSGLSAASCALISVNTMMGPGLLAIPESFQLGGWFPNVVAIFLGALITADVAVLLGEAITLTSKKATRLHKYGTVPLADANGDGEELDSDHQDKDTWEFGSLSRHYGGEKLGYISDLLLGLSLLALACAQIIVTAQAMDGLIVWLHGKTYAYAPWSGSNVVLSSDVLSVMPFPKNTIGISAGFLVDAVICITLGFLPLADNVIPQYVFFALFNFALIVLMWHFINPHYDPMIFNDNRTPIVGHSMNGVVGVVIFNYAYIVAVPVLRSDAHPRSSFSCSMRVAVAYMAVMYFIFGLCGSFAFKAVNENLLVSVLRDGVPVISKLAVFALSFALQPSIPVYVILLSRSMAELGIRSPVFWANFIPWSLAACAYMQSWFLAIVNWSGLLVLGFMNYSIPLALVILAVDSNKVSKDGETGFLELLWIACNSSGRMRRAGIYFVLMNTLICWCIFWNLESIAS